jgi:hypothetical protein
MKTVTILTCDRSPSYLTDTVKTIPEEYNIQYISQGEIVMPKNGEIIHVEKAYASDSSRHRDSQYNYAQALLNTKDGFIIEDDVQFSKDFNNHYEKVLQNLPSSRYVIALYACYDFWNNPLVNNLFAKYPVDNFYGTQAMLFDIHTAREFGKYLAGTIGKEAYDLALKTFIKEINPNVKLYATKYSLVQHIGQVSTGLGHHHQTANFIDDKTDINF